MAVERIDVVFTERGSRTVRRNIAEVGESADGAQGAVQLLRRALGLLAAGAAINKLRQTVDTFTNIQNRLKNVAATSEQAAAATERLFQISNRTRQSFESTAEVYSRTALALKDVGASQEEVLQFTESLNQAVILSGASAAEANAALIQLSQGLASGTLRGDELRSVLEQLPAVADVIARGLGVTRGELRKLGEEGKITAQDILQAFAKARGELADKFGKTVPTIGQAMTVLDNQFTQFVGTLDKTTGASQAVARLILLLGDNMELLARVAGAAGITLATVFAARGLAAAVRGVLLLNAAILANPLIAFSVALVAVVSALVTFSDQIAVSSDGLVTLRDLGQAVFEQLPALIGSAASFLSDTLGGALEFVTGALSTFGLTFQDVLEGARFVANAILGYYVGLGRALGLIFGKVGELIDLALGSELAKTVLKAGQAIIDFYTRAFTFIFNVAKKAFGFIGDAGKELGEKLGVAFEPGGDGLASRTFDFGKEVKDAFISGFSEDYVGDFLAAASPAFDALTNRAAQIAAERRKANAASEASKAAGAAGLRTPGVDVSGAAREREFQKQIRQISQETDLLRLNNREREIQTTILQVQEKFGKTLTEGERSRLDAMLRTNQALRDQAEAYEDIRGPQEGYETRLKAIQGLLAAQRITQDEANRALRDARIALLDTQTSVGAGFERGFLKAQRDLEDFASSAETLITDAFTNAQEVVVNFFKTGKFEAADFFQTLADQFLRLGTQQLFASAFGGGGLGGGISSLLGGATGGAGGGIGGIFSSLFSGLFGFADGGSFEVGKGSAVGTLSGVDNRLIAFRARDGENVTITPPGQTVQGGSRTTNNFYFPPGTDAAQFRRSQGQIEARQSVAAQRAAKRNT